MSLMKWFECACGQRIPTISGHLEVHKKFCGKLRAKRKAQRLARKRKGSKP